MGSLFEHNSTVPQGFQNNQDPITYVESMLQRTGGNAKDAFFMAAKEKGVDPNQIINQVKSMGDPQAMLQGMLMGNPNMQRLISLFSTIK